MTDSWKDDIIKNKLGGKRDWTDVERLELSKQLDNELDDFIASPSQNASERSGWTEENWKEKMGEHPIFAPYLNEAHSVIEAPANDLCEGLAQLKFDPDENSPSELALSYKEEGVLQFKYKKYRLAIANFSEGLKHKSPDSELNAQLYNNRAAAHFHLQNFRSCIRDCEEALNLKPDYVKAIERAIKCSSNLKSWDEMLRWCDRGFTFDPSHAFFRDSWRTANKEKKVEQNEQRKSQLRVRKKQQEEEDLLSAIRQRKIILKTVNKDSSSVSVEDLYLQHPTALNCRVHLNEERELVWPVVIKCPEHQVSEYVLEFNETSSFTNILEGMFGPDAAPVPWDEAGKYVNKNIKLFYGDNENKLIKIDPLAQLGTVLNRERFVVFGGVPVFFIFVAGSAFLEEFLSR